MTVLIRTVMQDAQGNDSDGDGFIDIADCDDTNFFIYPGAQEIPADGIDQDCDGADENLCSDTDVETGLMM